MSFLRSLLISDLCELLTSPLSKNSYLDIVVKIDGEEPICTNKLAVYLLFPYLKDVLSSSDYIILPKTDSKRTIAILQFNFQESEALVQNENLFIEKEDLNLKVDPKKECKEPIIQTFKEEIMKSCSFKCPHCPSTYPKKRDLKRHLVKHSNESYMCPVCGIRIKHLQNFKRHSTLHDDQISFHYCKFCDKAFNRKTNYRRHLESVHNFIVN